MQRRTFLKALGALPAVAYIPFSLSATSSKQPMLILVQLGGGNDSLNTFVPFTNTAYYEARGALAVEASTVLPLTDELGLNPAMEAIKPAWDSGDVAIVQGLGYAEPNRSHFRSIDIWHTASDANEFLVEGWLSQALSKVQQPLQAVSFAGGQPFAGEADQFSVGRGGFSRLKQVYAPEGEAKTEAVSYVMSQRESFNTGLATLTDALSSAPALSAEFATDIFSQQCKTLAQLTRAGVRPHVVHLSLGSFDTHNNQRNQHDRLLTQLSQGLASLREEWQHQGIWSHCTIATYAEFGRRVAKNASEGTDHGTAASHLVMGGAVKGGLHGIHPSLTDLYDGDMHYTTDFRQLYRSLSDWMGWQPSEQLQPFAPLDVLI